LPRFTVNRGLALPLIIPMLQTEIAVMRFGLGARPGDLQAAAADPRGWLRAQTQGPVALTGADPLTPADQILAAAMAAREQRRERKREGAAAAEEATALGNALREIYQPHYHAQVLARAQSAAATSRPFGERLVHFWSNHFAISADKGAVYGLAGTLENEAIRPHVNGRFVDLLTAAVKHPAMIVFLDNQLSAGADSIAARAAAAAPGRQFGINENLAREILELHTLGVNGGYTQQDVTGFAQIITGWSVGGGGGRLAGGEVGRYYFRDGLHQPGAKTMLGKSYPQYGEAQGLAALADLSSHPATAHFIATKLVRHFVADDPPPPAVERVARAYRETGGDLPRVYAALIDAPHAWDLQLRKLKTPEDFVFSTLRAFDAAPRKAQEVIRSFELLGQRQYTPGSPAGWADTARNWDGPDALMHRVLWASRVAERFERGQSALEVAASCLGGFARPETLAALKRAASGAQALALLLMSPEFQRR
jgi:uncharacterized protein (DUF1800 family)